MKKKIYKLLILLCMHSFFTTCSYKKITDPELLNNLNYTRRSIASNQVSNLEIKKNLGFCIETYGKNFLTIQSSTGNTLLSEAAFRGRFPIVQLLLNHEANPDPIDENGNTPLHRVSQKRSFHGYKEIYIEIMKLLIDHTDTITHKNNEGKTVLNLISKNKMLSKKSKLNLSLKITGKNHIEFKPTLLHDACKNGSYTKTIRIISSLDCCNPHEQNEYYETPLNLIAMNHNLSFFQKNKIIETLHHEDQSRKKLTLEDFLPTIDYNTYIEIDWN